MAADNPGRSAATASSLPLKDGSPARPNPHQNHLLDALPTNDFGRLAPHLELIPMIRRLYESFGPQRLMWASDSPYQNQGDNNYKASISLVRDHLDFVSAEDRQWLLRKTAERVFFFG